MALDVFKKLRIKLALSITLVLAVVLFALIGSINLYLGSSNRRLADNFINELVLNEGERPRPDSGPIGERQGPVFKPGRNPGKDNSMTSRPQPPELRDMNQSSGNQGSNFSQYDSNMNPPPKLNSDHGPQEDTNPQNMPRMDGGISPDLEENAKNTFSSIIPLRNNYMGFRNFYTAQLDSSGKITKVVNNFSEQFDSDQLEALVKTIFNLKKKQGTYQVFGYAVAKKEYGYLIVILDRAIELRQEQRFGMVSLLLFIVNLFIAYAIASTFSLWSLRPVQEAFVKQKQFIADASHELKTPIAVIGANIDVLQQEMPDNKWLDYVKTENARMSQLVKDLLYLAKNDAGREKKELLSFDLADATACAVLPFESVAFEQGKKLEINIPKNPVPVIADESKIKQVIIILTDNALKNSDSGALIKISAGFEGGNKRFVKVYNSGAGISPEDMEKIFDRFYRVDTSRNRNTGGYGLGLAIAQTIAKAHNGKITVASKVGEFAEFTLHLPSGANSKLHIFTKNK